MKRKKMLVTGAGGMVGGYVPQVFQEYGLTLTDLLPGFDHLDVRDPEAVVESVLKEKPDVVLHLAAATDVDRCQQEPDWAYQSNAIGTQNVVLACLKTGALLVYISTGAVFWGDKPQPYNELDPPRPANVYGHSKLGGEQIVTSLLQRYYIVRAGWMIGGGVSKDKKFIGKIAHLMAEGKSPLKVVHDKRGSPTYALDLLQGIRRLLETGYYGLYHMVNGGSCTRYEMALVLQDALGIPEVTIEPVSSDCFPLPAPRGRSEVLENLKLRLLGLDSMRSWQEALRHYIQMEWRPILLRSDQQPVGSHGSA